MIPAGPLSRDNAALISNVLRRAQRPLTTTAPLKKREDEHGIALYLDDSLVAGGEVVLARITGSVAPGGESKRFSFIEQDVSFTARPATFDKVNGVTGTFQNDGDT